MKAKLIKNHYGFDYFLADKNGNAIATSDNGKLSLKNCQEIEFGYDLDELAKNYLLNKWLPNTNQEDRELWYLTTDWSKEVVKIIKNFYIELMGDKKFSEEDIHEVYSLGEAEDRFGFHDFLQQNNQTEWDVDIVQEEGKDTFGNAELTWYNPKLDADGCLILKRI
jgi:hypothetical protein